MQERVIISFITAAAAIAAVIYLRRVEDTKLRLLIYSTPVLTGCLLLYYALYVYNPSHGISIVVLPMSTIWLIWRKRETGKPDFSSVAFILLQIAYCCLFMGVLYFQEG
ncbi:hypothetical protein KJ564_06340 [bacterium]|nr:hypothetical protein [bacterium]